QTGTDPYSAAVFQGFRASSGDNGHANSWQTSITANNPSACFTQQELERIPTKKTASLEITEQQNEQVKYSFGIQPILHSECSISDHNAEDKKVADEKGSGQQVEKKLISDNDVEGNISTGALLLKEKEQIITDAENGVSVVAVAQVTPMIATSIATTIATPLSVGVLSSNQTFPATVPSTANIARVGPISNHDSCGFSANRVVPPFQPVIPNPQISSLAPVISNARSTSLSLAEGIDETQTTVVVEKTQTVSNVVPVMNFQQANETAVSIKKQESVASNASDQLRKVVDESADSSLIDNMQGTQGQNELRQILKDDREHSITISTSAEQSTDSTAPENSFNKATEKHRDSKNVRDRYRIIRKQYPEVIKRLDRLRMETHRLDWHPTQKASSIEIDESSNRS
ncbi:unnamed protein product, partial [Onchocerca ochengi]